MMQHFLALILSCAIACSHAAYDIGWNTDSDLTSFVTRPDIKAPLFNVAIYDSEHLSPGYWFLGPYAEIQQKPNPPKYYSACQTGPHIYDAAGSLVWSGACQFRNQNACDFRVWNINGTDYLSAIMYKYKNDTTGHGIIMNNAYQPVKYLMSPSDLPGWNMHELSIVNDGSAALYLTFRPEYVNVSMIPNQSLTYGWITNMGIREVDLRTDEVLFEWWAHPEVSLSESNVEVSQLQGPYPQAWNWFHGNSIVKNAAGDYLVNSRYTDTVYKISGRERKIIWRLGGGRSDFEMNDFNFSRQHDARWVEECDDKTEVITLLDNASDGITSTADTSSAIQIRLDKESMTATVVKRWVRPDDGRSDLRGNFQHLPNGNLFAAWSDNSFISEHTTDGELVMAAEFSSERFVTYRAYKFNFTGTPTEPPVIKAFAFGVDPESATTVVYMSWNGATEVDSWNVYSVSRGVERFIGNAPRAGFETRFQSKGFEEEVFVKAMAADESSLGQSAAFLIEPPKEWGWGSVNDWQTIHNEDLDGWMVDQSQATQPHWVKTEL